MAITIDRWWAGALAPFDWSMYSWLPVAPASIRIESYLDGDTFVVRAELPGIDPARDVRVTTAGGALRIQVERVEETRDKVHTEFRYGTLARTVPLPPDARQDSATASYADGILRIAVAMGEARASEREIPITVDEGAQH